MVSTFTATDQLFNTAMSVACNSKWSAAAGLRRINAKGRAAFCQIGVPDERWDSHQIADECGLVCWHFALFKTPRVPPFCSRSGKPSSHAASSRARVEAALKFNDRNTALHE